MKSYSDNNATTNDLDMVVSATEMKIKDAQRAMELQLATAGTNNARMLHKVEADLNSKVDDTLKESRREAANLRVMHASLDQKIKMLKRICFTTLIMSGISVAVILHFIVLLNL